MDISYSWELVDSVFPYRRQEMKFRLSAKSVIDYLSEWNLCSQQEQDKFQIEPVAAKNFNLLVTFPDGQKFLVKQEQHNQEGKAAGELLSEWRIQEFLQHFPELSHLRSSIPEVLHFDAENLIIVFKWLDDHRDLTDFYTKENVFPTEMASSIGTVLATLHRATFNRQDYQEFFSQHSDNLPANQAPHLIRGLERIGPEVFGQVPPDGIKFFALYQRYDSLGQAIAELGNAFKPVCVTHNDLKLNNILLNPHWEQPYEEIVRLIDWERSSWGDPAFDLGALIAGYLQIWLNSLVVSQSLNIEESLRLATVPLEKVQPSIAALTQAYFHTFPEILESRTDFLLRGVQFAGFALIQQIQAAIQYEKSFGNTGIAMLQVAKSLLCRPQKSMPTIFGTAADELIQLSRPDAANV